MANRIFHGTQALDRAVKIIAGQVSIKADATVDSANQVGMGFSAARTGTGEYTITLQDTYSKVLSVNVTVEAATGVDLVPQIKSTSTSSAVVRLNTGATATDPAAVCKLHITMMLKNSSV